MELNNLRVISVHIDYILFSNNVVLRSDHDQDCCEQHYLDFSNLSINDFDGLLFDLSGNTFFTKVEGYGIRLVPTNGFPISVPGYYDNNGYYSDELTLNVIKNNQVIKSYDITECQPNGDL